MSSAPRPSPTKAGTQGRLSPDGRFIAVVDGDSIIVIDHARGSRIRLGRQGAENRRPVWSADGREITFQADTDIFQQSVDLRRSEIVLNRPGMQYPDDISPQGAALLFNEGGASRDLWVLSNGKPQPLLVTPASEGGGAFSPDGAWIAFTSDESGRDEIYLIHPDGSGKPWSRRAVDSPQCGRPARQKALVFNPVEVLKTDDTSRAFSL